MASQKAADGAPATGFPATDVVDSDAVSAAWLSPGPALTVSDIWGVCQQVEDFSPTLSSLSL